MNNTINYYKYNKYKYKYLKKIGGSCNLIKSKTLFIIEIDICDICQGLIYDNKNYIIGLSCNHVFHEYCMMKEKNLHVEDDMIKLTCLLNCNDCPVCRKIPEHYNIITKINDNIFNIIHTYKLINYIDGNPTVVISCYLNKKERKLLVSCEIVKSIKYTVYPYPLDEAIINALNYIYIVLDNTDLEERNQQIIDYTSSLQTPTTYQNKELDFMVKIKYKVKTDDTQVRSQDNVSSRPDIIPPQRFTRYSHIFPPIEQIPYLDPIINLFGYRPLINRLTFTEITIISETNRGILVLIHYFIDRHNTSDDISTDIPDIDLVNVDLFIYYDTLKQFKVGCKKLYEYFYSIKETGIRHDLLSDMNDEEFKEFLECQIKDKSPHPIERKLEETYIYSERANEDYQCLNYQLLDNERLKSNMLSTLSSTKRGSDLLLKYLYFLIISVLLDKDILSYLPVKRTTYDTLILTRLGIYRLINYVIGRRKINNPIINSMNSLTFSKRILELNRERT